MPKHRRVAFSFGNGSPKPSADRTATPAPETEGDNYETRLLSELSQLTTEMVLNRRRVRVIMGELAQLWDAVDDDREALESEQRGRASVFD